MLGNECSPSSALIVAQAEVAITSVNIIISALEATVLEVT
jgi:hypothetical protein